MKKAVYKTNINCGMCLSTVTPHLNKLESINDWSVDLQSKDRLLTVTSDNLNHEEVIRAVDAAGFKAEKKGGLFSKFI